MFRTLFTLLAATPLLTQLANAQSIPLMIPHSGTVSSKGALFNGDGFFRFAIINGDSGCQGSTPATTCDSYWSNDGSSVDGKMPVLALKISVSNGQFSVKLGDITRVNDNSSTVMPAIDIDTFSRVTTYLRVWFDDGTTGPQLLVPDRQLVAVPYAYRAAVAEKVTGTNGIVSVTGQGHFSRDAMGQCCSPADPVAGSGLQDFTLSVAEATRKNGGEVNTGRRATIQFHNGNEVEGFIRLAAGGNSQPLLASGQTIPRSLPLTNRRFIFGSYQEPMSGEFTGDIYAGAGSALLATDGTGSRYARLLHTEGSSGNLHLDPLGGGNSYINWFGGASLHVGNGTALNYGPITASAFTVASSRKLKNDISSSRYGLREVLKLDPVSYKYVSDSSHQQYVGLIAEDVDAVIPEVVQHDEQGQASGIDYGKLSVVLINAVKELKQQNDDLRREIDALRRAP